MQQYFEFHFAKKLCYNRVNVQNTRRNMQNKMKKKKKGNSYG